METNKGNDHQNSSNLNELEENHMLHQSNLQQL